MCRWATRTRQKTTIVSSYTEINNTTLVYNNLNENIRLPIIDIKKWTDHGEQGENRRAVERGYEE